MRKMLNVLYVTNPDAYLFKDGENLVIKVEDKEIFRTPIHYLEGVVTFGYKGASPGLLGMCVDRGVTVTFLSPTGKYLASVRGITKGNVLLRRKQYRMADSPTECTNLATRFIMGKIGNCRVVIRRLLSDHSQKGLAPQCKEVNGELVSCIVRLNRAMCLDEVRGIEGEAARKYFSVFDNLILQEKDVFFMKERNRRPPLDNVNALLSFLYSLLAHECRSALETVGLDPYVGFLHRDRPGRASLALDLMEEVRPYMVDRLVLSLVNRRQLTGSDFIKKESGGVILKDNARKTVLDAWQKRKQEEITHPFLDEKIPVGLLPYAQAMLLARYLRGDLDDYPVFLWK